jgi:hypothetical protein
MTTVDQFLKALAMVESSDDPEAWGDAGRAMGRWQVHPDRLFGEMATYKISPKLGETWDQLVERVLRVFVARWSPEFSFDEIAQFWHLGHWPLSYPDGWDMQYASKFEAALAKA